MTENIKRGAVVIVYSITCSILLTKTNHSPSPSPYFSIKSLVSSVSRHTMAMRELISIKNIINTTLIILSVSQKILGLLALVNSLVELRNKLLRNIFVLAPLYRTNPITQLVYSLDPQKIIFSFVTFMTFGSLVSLKFPEKLWIL